MARGEPLFRLYGGANWIGENELRAQVAFGPERTIDQDSTFAFRVIADVAIKALSTAINDPTTRSWLRIPTKPPGYTERIPRTVPI